MTEQGVHRLAVDGGTGEPYTPHSIGGTTVKTLQRLCQDDKATLDMLDRETVAGPGAPEGNQNAVGGKTISNNVTVCLDEPERGTSSTYALRRLRTARPDLHERPGRNKKGEGCPSPVIVHC